MGGRVMRSSWQTKQSHNEWPGVVFVLDETRLIVAEGEAGAYFRLQYATGSGNIDRAWQAVPLSSRSTLSELQRDFAHVKGLVQACRDLPDSPLEVLPEFWEQRWAEDEQRRREWSNLLGGK
jgi:hypothetical protein